jgi:hypothetical protein
VRGDLVRQRADDRELVGQPRELRQVLADAEAGHAGGDRPELAADLFRRVGLGVERVHLGRAAPGHDHQHRLLLAGSRFAREQLRE